MIFNGIEKNSLIEWPGKVSAVLFLGGCSFRCPFCYNRGLVLDPNKLPALSEKKILAFLGKRKNFLDGIMITGGEPLLDVRVEELIEFIKKVKAMGLGVGLETNGSNPVALKKIIDQKLINYVAMDIKAPVSLPTKYQELTGTKIDIKKIKKSLNLIKKSGLNYEFRTTVAPLLKEEDILQIAKDLKGIKKYVLQVFRPVDSLINPRLAKMKFFAREDLEEIGQKIKNNFVKFEIRG
jgi:pyruvate formate lyase activating enzyme